ncbi:tRNA (adenine(37)-N6)-methyltransferase [Macrobrachium rosenbergii]|uniref:tRNA (adenine(37)-N6)-methyltransferase n=1 Tax=Macrobrachium rosenbergii TaxID=79674 RepID=UPI0034D3F07C
MASVEDLVSQLMQARNEINNLRKKMRALQAQHQKDIEVITKIVDDGFERGDYRAQLNDQQLPQSDSPGEMTCLSRHFSKWRPIGHIQSWYHTKNGTPRQGSVSPLSRGVLCIDKSIFNNPHHSLDGLEEYSYVWVMFIFDQNGEGPKGSHSKSKVAPPRLNGERIGVFATRSPHRPNPLGLTLAKLEKVEGNCVYLSGLDILDGTPVIDIKPYIPEYDSPPVISPYKCNVMSKEAVDSPIHGMRSLSLNEDSNNAREIFCRRHSLDDHLSGVLAFDASRDKMMSFPSPSTRSCEDLSEESHTENRNYNEFGGHSMAEDLCMYEKLPYFPYDSKQYPPIVKVAEWVKAPPIPSLVVEFNPVAEAQIKQFSAGHVDDSYRLEYLRSHDELQSAIYNILQEDPRSSYRRTKCASSLYYFTVDTAHVTVWFDGQTAEVLRVKPLHGRKNLVPKEK